MLTTAKRTIAARPLLTYLSSRMTLSTPVPAQWPDRYGDELYRFALSRVSAAEVAEELVQETFLSALNGLATFRAEASERTWLFVILRRKIIDHYRRQARITHIGLDEISDGGPTVADFLPLKMAIGLASRPPLAGSMPTPRWSNRNCTTFYSAARSNCRLSTEPYSRSASWRNCRPKKFVRRWVLAPLTIGLSCIGPSFNCAAASKNTVWAKTNYPLCYVLLPVKTRRCCWSSRPTNQCRSRWESVCGCTCATVPAATATPSKRCSSPSGLGLQRPFAPQWDLSYRKPPRSECENGWLRSGRVNG